jgi:hypothetical protein
MRSAARAFVTIAILAACGIDARGTLEGAPDGPGGPSGSSGSSGVGPSQPGSTANGSGAGDGGLGSDATDDGDADADAAAPTLLTWTRAVPAATVDLTAEGPLDWAHWGANGNAPNRKAGVTTLISDYTNDGSPEISPSTNNPSSFSWTDGTPQSTHSGTTSHVYFKGEANVTVTLTVATAPTKRTSFFYMCLNRTRARFEVDLTDGSIAPTSEELEKNDGAMCVRYDVDYRSANASARVRVRWTMLTVVDPANSTIRISAVTVKN